MSTLRVFLAHPKSEDDLDALAARTKRAVEARLAVVSPGAGVAVEVVTGRDDFMSRAAEAGGWEAWTESVSKGQGYRNGTLGALFDLIVVAPSPLFGKGTARIVHHALQSGKPVYWLSGEDGLLTVWEMVEHDANDWKNGWAVRVRGGG